MIAVLALVYGLSAALAAGIWALVCGTFLALPYIFLPRGKRETRTIRAAVWFAAGVLKAILGVRCRVSGSNRLAQDEGAIIFCNHQSWLDPLVLMQHLRSNGLSKREISYIPIIGQFGYLTGAVFFNRADRQDRMRARKEVLDMVQNGHRIQVFPEGTRSTTGELRETVHLTLGYDAYRRGIPIVPCAIHGSNRVLPPTQAAAYPCQEVALDIGPPMYPADYDGAGEFAVAAWEQVKERYAKLRSTS